MDPYRAYYRRWISDQVKPINVLVALQYTNVRFTFLFVILANDPNVFWRRLRKFLPKGPLVNAEFYPGWLTHWMEPMARVESEPVINTLRLMLNQKANVNFYMFFGGTNFGFTAGANDIGAGKYGADITSYDYDAPLDEAGDPTEKYFEIRKVLIEVRLNCTNHYYGHSQRL